jgi:hypothetical protein
MNRFHDFRLPSSAFRLSSLLLTTHLSLLTFFFVLPAFAQQRWERNYGWPQRDEGYSVQQTTDGGYIVAGWTIPIQNAIQVYLIKTDAFGDTLWTRTYGGANVDEGNSVQQTQDGGYIVAGYTNSFGDAYGDVYLIKTNPLGDTLWARTYGGTGIEEGYSVQQTTDGGYIIAGVNIPYGSIYDNIYLIKTNDAGDTLWTRTYSGTGTDSKYGYSVQQTSDGGYIVAGETHFQVYLIKTNALGDTLWSKTYGGNYGYSVQQTSEGGYIVAGGTYSVGDSDQVYLIKTNTSGDPLWTRTYGGIHNDYGYSVRQTSDGGYIVAGTTYAFGNLTQVYLIKTNAFGDTLWTKTYGGGGHEAGNSAQQTTDGGYIVAGYTYSFGNGEQVYLIKTDANGSSGVEEVRNAEFGIRHAELRTTPNPFTSFTTVPSHSSDRFALYDISGRRVGTYRGDRIGEGLRVGVYFLRAEGGKAKPVRTVKVR